MAVIIDGTGKGNSVKVTSDNRLTTDSITESISAERSRAGKLFGVGGSFTPTGSFDLDPVLYLRNDSNTEDLYIQKLVFGWNGGSTNYNRTILSFIKYNTTPPTGAATSIDDAIENISLSGSDVGVSSGQTTTYKWDGSGTGMTGSTGGFLQIPHRLSQGSTAYPIDGEIILGAGNSMEINCTPDETGEFNAAIIYYFAPAGKGRSFI